MERCYRNTPPTSLSTPSWPKFQNLEKSVLCTPPPQKSQNGNSFEQLPSPTTPTAPGKFGHQWDPKLSSFATSEIATFVKSNTQLISGKSAQCGQDLQTLAQELLSSIDPIHDPTWKVSAAPLGQGSHSCVYDLQNTALSSLYALKVPQSSRKRSHIYKEALILTQLQIPMPEPVTIVPFHGLTLVNKSHCKRLRSNETVPAIVLERMNCSLKHYYTHSAEFDAEQWWLLASSLFSSLQLLKARNIVHGDIKTENVLLNFDSNSLVHFYLADFSSARPAVPSDTQFPVLDATLEYCSPEQITNSVTPSFDTDLYSVGLTLLACITKAEPYAELLSSMVRGSGLGARSSLPQTQWLMSAIAKNTPLEFNVLHDDLWMEWHQELTLVSRILQDRITLDECLASLEAHCNSTI